MDLDDESIPSPRKVVLHRDEDLREELGESSRRKEHDGLSSSDSTVLGSFASVKELIVGDETEDVNELIRSGREDSVVLRNVKMSVDFVGGDGVDVGVILFETLASDFTDLFRNGCGEEEGLSIVVVGYMSNYRGDIVGETHIEEGIGFIENEHSRVGDAFAN